MQNSSSTTLIRRHLAGGTTGTRQTLRLMQQLARQGAGDAQVRDAALSIVRAAGVAGHDYTGELAAIQRYVADVIRFTRDPADLELVQTPRRTLELGAGDCDDKATLLVALLRAIGHPARLAFRVIGTDPTRPQRFSHVYVIARLDDQELALDPTRAGTPLGWQHPRPTRIGEFALWAT